MITENRVENEADEQLCDYELIFIISPDVVDEQLEARIEGVSQFITAKGGTISEVEPWGKKRLAYPIRHFGEGSYVLVRFQSKPGQNKELEANLKISEDILRHLLIKLSKD